MSNELIAFLITIGTGLFGAAAASAGKILSQLIEKRGMELVNTKWKSVSTVVDISVEATEQMYQVAKKSGKEFDRKTFAMGLVKDALERRKIKDITEEDIDVLIEAKVLNMPPYEPSEKTTEEKEPPKKKKTVPEGTSFGMGGEEK